MMTLFMEFLSLATKLGFSVSMIQVPLIMNLYSYRPGIRKQKVVKSPSPFLSFIGLECSLQPLKLPARNTVAPAVAFTLKHTLLLMNFPSVLCFVVSTPDFLIFFFIFAI